MQRLLQRLLALCIALCLLPAVPAARAEDGATVRVTELMIKNKATIRDADGDFSDWIELENASGRPVSLLGWTLSDREERAGWALPERVMQPGERLLLFADGKDRGEGELHTDFALSEGETLLLRAPDGTVADAVPCEGAESDVSLVRTEAGFVPCNFPTPGYYDTNAGYEAWQQSCEPLGALEISEVCVYEQRARFGEELGACDWVEVRNRSGEALPLAGWTLSDGKTNYALPAKQLGAGECLLLRCDEATTGYSHDYCTGFALSAENERLFLRDPDGALSDWAALRGIPLGASFGRAEGRGGWCYFADPTPGHPNAEGFRRVSAMPVSAEPDGVFKDAQSVTVTLTAAGEIRYTLDGSLPDAQSALYSEPLTFTETTVLRAVAIEPDALPSRALSLSYILNEGHTLPVASLLSDSLHDLRKLYEHNGPVQRITANVAFYDETGGGFNLPCEVRLNGETSLVLPKKNLSLRFRAAYGVSELNYDCFGGGVTRFTNLLLRSGQSYNGAVMKNELGCALAEAATDAVCVQRFRYCALYINGEYAGIYALMEKTNEQMAADWMGVSKDSVTVVEASAHADSEFYREVFEPATTLDLCDDENYRLIEERLDIASLIDWTIIEGWCANKDLQSGNLRYARSTENDGRWRLMLYDLDATFSGVDACFDILSAPSLADRQIGQLLSALLQNASFRDRFLTRAAALFSGPLSDAALLAQIDRLEAILAPEIPRNHAMLGLDAGRWPESVALLRALCDGKGWTQTCIDTLCQRLKLSAEERAAYFGDGL